MLLKLLLTVEKYQIVTAMSGKEALERVQQDRPDLILLDIMMPDMDGYEVTRQIRQLPAPYNDVSIIFLTALNNTEDIVKGFLVGGNDYITKPFSREELLSRVNHQISLEAAKRII
jgi:two-component system sensor histidine kinase/response regulator